MTLRGATWMLTLINIFNFCVEAQMEPTKNLLCEKTKSEAKTCCAANPSFSRLADLRNSLRLRSDLRLRIERFIFFPELIYIKCQEYSIFFNFDEISKIKAIAPVSRNFCRLRQSMKCALYVLKGTVTLRIIFGTEKDPP